MSRVIKYTIFFMLSSILGYVTWEVVYLSTAPADKYYCPVDLSQDASPGTYINDVSCLNKTRVHSIVRVRSEGDISRAITQARVQNLHVASAGVRHSMGGQAFYLDAIVLDMTHFNKILSLDIENKLITVQSGATWHEIQNALNPHNLAVKAMQSTDIFTVGGSLSVNAHGMDHRAGSVASTVHSFTLMQADGTLKTVSRNKNPKLFNLVAGGYGLFGVIVTVTLAVTDNAWYHQDIQRMRVTELPTFFDRIIRDDQYGLFYAHLSTSPVTFFRDVVTYSYKKLPHYNKPFPKLGTVSLVRLRRLLINISKRRWYGRVLKWVAEKYLDPLLFRVFKQSRVSRNEVMHDSVPYLENIVAGDTDILHEYFVPRDQLLDFIERIRTSLLPYKHLVLNASIRYVPKENIFLNYAPVDMFAIVLYINQKINPKALKEMKYVTQLLIDDSLEMGGTFFLPYQLHFTRQQLKAAYPDVDEFFKLKRRVDPHELFMNTFYATYA